MGQSAGEKPAVEIAGPPASPAGPPPYTAPTATAPPAASPAAPPPPPAPFTPSQEIVAEGELSHGRAWGMEQDGKTKTLLDPGWQVELLSEDGDYVTVRRPSGPSLRVDRRSIRPLPKA